MSILDLEKNARIALGLDKKGPERNPLETFGFAWQITIPGLSDDDLYPLIRNWTQKVVTQIHPDNTGRPSNQEELAIMDAFEQLKNFEDFKKYLREFKERRSEEAHYSRIIKEKSSKISRKSDALQEEITNLQEILEDSRDENRLLNSRIMGLLRMQTILDKPKDNRLEIVGGKSTQVSVTSLNNVKQIVICRFEAEFAPEPSEDALSEYKSLRPKIIKWNKRLKELRERKLNIEREYRGILRSKDNNFAKKKLDRVHNQISDLEIKLQRAKDYIILHNIGFLTLENTIKELLKRKSDSKLPILRFDPNDLFTRIKLPFKFYDRVKDPYAFIYEPLLSKIERIERSSEDLELLCKSYFNAIKFYQTNSPKGMIVRRLLIHVQVLPVENGILMVPIKNTKGESDAYRKVMGCIPTNHSLLSDRASFTRRGELIFTEREILKNMIPCVAHEAVLITTPIQRQNKKVTGLLKSDANSFFKEINQLPDMEFLSEGIAIAVYT